MKLSLRQPVMFLSPERVLECIQDWYRIASELDLDVEPDQHLSFDTPVQHWRAVCNLLPDAQLGEYLNRTFGINATDIEWLHVLRNGNNLREVCTFISKKGAKCADAAPLKIAGVDCALAGIFLALRSMLIDAGVPLAGAAPSTKLARVLDEHLDAFVSTLSKLAPGALPVPEQRFKDLFASLLRRVLVLMLILLGIELLLAPGYFGTTLVVCLCGLLFGFAICNRYIRSRYQSNFYLKGVDTLADLVRLIERHNATAEAG